MRKGSARESRGGDGGAGDRGRVAPCSVRAGGPAGALALLASLASPAAAAPLAQTPLPVPPLTPEQGGWELLAVLSLLALVLGVLTVRKRVRRRREAENDVASLVGITPSPPEPTVSLPLGTDDRSIELGRLGTRALGRLDRRLQGVSDLDEALARSVATLHESLDGAPVAVWIASADAGAAREGKGGARRWNDCGLLDERGAESADPIPLFEPWQAALAAGESVCIPDPAAEPDLCGRLRLQAGSLALVPFPRSVEITGATVVAWPSPSEIGPLEMALAERLGAGVGHALERARLVGEIETLRRSAAQRSPAVASDRRRTASRASDGITILLVDEKATTTAFLADALVGEGYRVMVTASAAAAVECLAGESVDLVLCDAELPDLGGWELARHCRELYEELPLVLIGRRESREEALMEEVGVHEVLSPPYRLEEALAAVSRALASGARRSRAA